MFIAVLCTIMNLIAPFILVIHSRAAAAIASLILSIVATIACMIDDSTTPNVKIPLHKPIYYVLLFIAWSFSFMWVMVGLARKPKRNKPYVIDLSQED